jgi:hypothetical protein
MPSDDTIKKMDIIINKRLKGVTISDFYDIVFSEGNGTKRAP